MSVFTQTTSKRTVAGIDVGGDRKGFHAVALNDGRFIDQKTDCDPEKIVEWCLHNQASVVAVDAPCLWSRKGGSRLAERHLAAKKIYCFATPTRERAEGRNFYRWMFNGERLYQALASKYQLFDGKARSRRICFEIFPHATMCSFNGLVKVGRKAATRRAALKGQGYDVSRLTNIDFVDAALCAFTAKKFRAGQYASYGECEEGVIVVPA